MQHQDPATGAGPALPGPDRPALGRYLATAAPGLVNGPLSATLIVGGKSDLTQTALARCQRDARWRTSHRPDGDRRTDSPHEHAHHRREFGAPQAEAALELFRPRNNGHLVLISSMSAVRGLPRSINAYAASKAAVSAMGEGLQAEFLRSPIVVSTILPGYIRTDLSEKVRGTPMIVGIDKGHERSSARSSASHAGPASRRGRGGRWIC